MPFQSEKQRRYLHANHPEIANRWEAKYGLGGIAELNSQLNQLPEYYLPKNQGGFIPSHEAGIYGLAEGGNIRLQPHTASDLLVQKTSSGERPKYQPPGHGSGESKSGSSSSSGPGPGGQGARGQATQNPGTSSSPSKSPGHPSNQSSGSTKTTTKSTGSNGRNIHRDTGKEEDAYVMVGGKKVHQPKWGTKDDPREQIEYTGSEDLEEQLEIDLENARRKLKYDPNLTKDERENLEVGLGLRKAKSKSGFWGFLGKGILTLATAGAGAGVFGKDAMKVAKLVSKYKKGKNIYDTLKKGEVNLFGKKLNLNRVTNKLKTSDQKLMASLPKGHPERIALEAQMKVRTPPKHDGDGATTSIKIEDIETVNDANAEQVQLKKYREMELASYRAMIQQQEDRSKQMAYWKQMMAPYMAARGGRIPGYNTGGLSNLFRLKNV